MKHIIERLRTPPEPWSHGGKLPWNDPGFSERMLREHLSQEHDRASRRTARIEEHVAWIHEHVLGCASARVLDLGCGPGLYTQRLASRGHQCLGIDFSPKAIEYARTAAGARRESCRYELADLAEANLTGTWDAVLLLFGELNTFPPDIAAHLLRRVRGVLAPGGRVVLEVHEEAFVRSIGARAPTWSAHRSGLFREDPHLLLRDAAWCESRTAAVERYVVFDAGGDVEAFASTTQAYSPEAYAALLMEAGLAVLEQAESLGGGEADPERQLFVLLAGEAASPA